MNGKSENMIHTANGSNVPSKLNFAVIGTLTINDDEFEVCLGQGHYDTTNNWHLCSTSIEAKENNKGGMLSTDGKPLNEQFYLSPSGTSGFDIQEVSQLSGEHDNEFKLEIPDENIDSIGFKLNDATVTIGQPFGGVETKVEAGQGIINVIAGRSKSDRVATWFNSKLGKGSCISSFAITDTPSELNFAIIGTLTFTSNGKNYEVLDYVLAQGANPPVQNNWWLGGPQMIGFKFPFFGGALGMPSLLNPPKGIVCWSILNTNEMKMVIVGVDKEGQPLYESVGELIKEK
ncbi:MAG: hypothetical protein JKY54_02900 [Flavobacteriales bacterium]|nr:hypothetical protein [Flavobacteriales bacterium]